MDKARLAKMHLGIDDARKNVEAPAFDTLVRRGGAQIADLRNTPIADADVSHTHAIVVDHGSVRQNEIEVARHGAFFLARGLARPN